MTQILRWGGFSTLEPFWLKGQGETEQLSSQAAAETYQTQGVLWT